MKVENKLEGKGFKQEYKRVLKEFLAECLEHPNVEGVILVGSYAIGLQNSRSDIDVCIITTDEVSYWKRGNIVKSGFIIEYSFYPVSYLKKLQAQDLITKKRLRTRMFATGKILFDKNGTIKDLQIQAQADLKEELPQSSNEEIEIKKYYLWDQLDNLHSLAEEKSPGFTYAYYTGLQEIIEVYANYLGLELPRAGRMHRFITDSKFRKRYKIIEIPDKEFAALFELAMQKPILENLRKLTELVHSRMGGFIIDGWTVSGPTNK